MTPPARSPDRIASSDLRGIPKVDLHLHAETHARLDRLRARRSKTPAQDWNRWIEVLATMPPGLPRLSRINGDFAVDDLELRDTEDEAFVSRVEDIFVDAAADGAILAEVRFGAGTIRRPRFMALFRDAESRVRAHSPAFHAEAIISGIWPARENASRVLDACISAREDGLAGIDFLSEPYDAGADWTEAYRWAERAAAAGLGITAHAGEFSDAHIAPALELPGLTRIGHAVYAASSEQLMARLAASAVTVECCITANVILGGVAALDDHPIRRLADRGVRVTVNTDNPLRLPTSIGREYALAAQLGFSFEELLSLSRNAIEASFTSRDRRQLLLADLETARP